MMAGPEIVTAELLDDEQAAHALSRPVAGTLARPDADTASGDSGSSTTLESFDVLLARNLDPPRRHLQQYLWMDTMAVDARAAVRLAVDWCERERADLEVTGMVRPGRLREPVFGELRVDWGLAVERRTPAGQIVRSPMSGIRIGFVATAGAENRHTPPQAVGDFRLITRKPTDRADPVCLAPVVDMVGFA